MTIGNGLGAPGTRVTKRLGPTDEVWLYVWQAIVGALALDLVLTLLLLSYAIIGWASLSLFLSASFFLIGLVVVVFGRPERQWVRVLFSNLWIVGLLLPFLPIAPSPHGFLLGQRWYGLIQRGVELVFSQIGAVFGLPWWFYAALGLALLVLVAKSGWRLASAVVVSLLTTGLLVLTDGKDWAAAWHALRWLLIPYSWPVIGFALLLALVMGKEMLFPSLEWTFQPVTLEELKEVGLIGLWMPGLFNKSQENDTEPEEPPEVVRAEHRDDSGNGVKERYAVLPSNPRARDFYKALASGRPFSLETARVCHVGRRTYENKIRAIFEARGWGRWKDDLHHDQGFKLTKAGWEMIESLVLNDPRH